ncbi:hypothetical protein MRX96_058592 [Rhipicephalus microplus]
MTDIDEQRHPRRVYLCSSRFALSAKHFRIDRGHTGTTLGAARIRVGLRTSYEVVAVTVIVLSKKASYPPTPLNIRPHRKKEMKDVPERQERNMHCCLKTWGFLYCQFDGCISSKHACTPKISE